MVNAYVSKNKKDLILRLYCSLSYMPTYFTITLEINFSSLRESIQNILEINYAKVCHLIYCTSFFICIALIFSHTWMINAYTAQMLKVVHLGSWLRSVKLCKSSLPTVCKCREETLGANSNPQTKSL